MGPLLCRRLLLPGRRTILIFRETSHREALSPKTRMGTFLGCGLSTLYNEIRTDRHNESKEGVMRFGVALQVTGLALLGFGCGSAQRPISAGETEPKKEPPPAVAQVDVEAVLEQSARMADGGDIDGAVALVKALHDAGHGTVTSHLLLGSYLEYDGQIAAAVATWYAGCTGGPEDMDLLISIANVRREQAEKGPQYSHHREVFTYRPAKPGDPSEEEWRKEKIGQAAEAMEQAMKVAPGDLNVMGNTADTYHEAGLYAKALPLWKQMQAADPGNAMVLSHLAATELAMGNRADALEAAKQSVASDPTELKAHEVMLEVYRAEGNKAEAEEASKRVTFYQWMPPFIALPYTDARYAFVKGFDGEKDVKKLIDQQSPESQAFLAAICWRHEHHGPVEDSAYRALEEQGARQLLLLLMENASSTCTIRAASHALGRMKEPQAFDPMIQQLPQDVQFVHYTDTAGALALLGDPRAVAPLIDVLAPEFIPPKHEDDPLMSGLGRRMARERAALALGRFDTPESRDALTRGVRNPDIAGACHLGRYLLDGKAEDLQAVEKHLEQDTFGAKFMIVAAMHDMPRKELQALADKYETDLEE